MLYKLFLYLKYRNITKELNQQLAEDSISLKVAQQQLEQWVKNCPTTIKKNSGDQR